jgi:hypothetical protein
MIRTLRIGTLALLVACLVLATADRAARGADKDDDKKKEEDAKKLAKIKAAGAAVDLLTQGKMKAADIQKAHDLEFVMYVFKPSSKGGLGKGDGFEVRIKDLASKKAPPLAKAALAAEADDLIRLATVTKAIAEVNDFYTPTKKEKDKDPKDWRIYTGEMKQSSMDLIDAVKGMDPDAVKKAATKLNNACSQCHAKFRDAL